MIKIRQWYLEKKIELLFWWNQRKLERQLDLELRPFAHNEGHEIYQDDTERKYAEGIALVKNKINSMTNKEPWKYDDALKQVEDLISLGTEETPSQRDLRKILTNLASLPEKPKKQMIQERIGHYVELQKYNEERALIRQIKQAKKDQDNELADKLLEEWKNKYGKVRNPRRR